MKFILATLLILVLSSTSFAAQYVNEYTKKDGTYVSGHYRSNSDSSYNNNYSVKGNTNPYTGVQGTRSRTYNDHTPSYNTKNSGSPGYVDSYRTPNYSGGSYRGSTYGGGGYYSKDTKYKSLLDE